MPKKNLNKVEPVEVPAALAKCLGPYALVEVRDYFNKRNLFYREVEKKKSK